MHPNVFNKLVDKAPPSLAPKTIEIARLVLVEKWPIKKVAAFKNITFQRVSAIKGMFEKLLNHDPIHEFLVHVAELVDFSSLPNPIKEKFVSAIERAGFDIRPHLMSLRKKK